METSSNVMKEPNEIKEDADILVKKHLKIIHRNGFDPDTEDYVIKQAILTLNEQHELLKRLYLSGIEAVAIHDMNILLTINELKSRL